MEPERSAAITQPAANSSEYHRAPTPNPISCPKTMAAMIVSVIVSGSLVFSNQNNGKAKPIANRQLA
jgi:hypothetical protein